jgi:hypothetical protein
LAQFAFVVGFEIVRVKAVVRGQRTPQGSFPFAVSADRRFKVHLYFLAMALG